ncbi:hypothetical protein LSH36_1969g00000 [Paralvinella palmiformis]|uniref:EGF-like domain-containing protein n=1 Tax=Paralvinella palmiformis TaxID=53620 RepID=A0AAD9MQG0_9ANNE|nr:hypothetical protein LSH36_1969g00000 [Paralvinella palmiformis]
MQLLTILILMFTCLCNLEAVNLFKKHHHKKILTTITARYPVKGPLGCEKLCLELADSCVAVNVLYTNHQYVCDVMATFPCPDEDVEELMTINPNGKLIIKQVDAIPRNCSSHPCQNGGVCLDTGLGYRCLCHPHYMGANCQIDYLVSVLHMSGTKCEAISEHSDPFKCENSFDRKSSGDDNFDLAHKSELKEAWINITFPRVVEIVRIQILQRYGQREPYGELTFEFSDSSSMTLTSDCLLDDCNDNSSVEAYLSPTKITTWIKLTAYNKCTESPRHTGFREIKYIGLIPDI